MAFRIKREELLAMEACQWGVDLHDEISKGQNNGTEDLKFKEWTPLHTEFLIQLNAKAAYFLMARNLIPFSFQEKTRAFIASVDPKRIKEK